ncbi:hypothetical protein Scep_013125 [Stephania cephalantha]|uniref:NAD-dependent epimerase/dehydratase domain-containing protein n=1 Tax=Stephania cephalantha TaxID=152367 RepID=A0AAP0P743_9MAGN
MERSAVDGGAGAAETYCVTGATGYVGSWVVRMLLERGWRVHATARDPEKVSQLMPMWKPNNRLKVFRADLQEEGSFDDAVKGCHGVFHVAASMEFNCSVAQNVESHVQTHVLDPAIKGVINLLKSCLKEKSLRRVVLTSSISTITAKDKDGTWKQVVDESCQTPADQVWSSKNGGWVYVLSKILSEQAAFRFANENGIDLVSVIPTTVAGPFITPAVPTSVQMLLSPITGNPELYSILSAVHARMGSIAVVHIEDICNAHIFLMKQTAAKGQYICSVDSCVMSELVEHLTLEHSSSNQQRKERSLPPAKVCSKRLTDLGFTYRYGLEEIIEQSVNCCVENGFLKSLR